MSEKIINNSPKGFFLSCHIIITFIEGVLILLYSLGIFFLITKIQFDIKMLEIPRSVLVMSLVPSSFILLPFLIYSIFISIYYEVSSWQLHRNLRIFKIHLIYMIFFALFILFWVL